MNFCDIPQAFTVLTCTSLIKRIDIIINNIFTKVLPKKLEKNEFKESTSKLNKSHEFYELLKLAFMDEDEQKKISIIIELSLEILLRMKEIIKLSVPHEFTELIEEYSIFMEKTSIPEETQEELFFWCFFYPFFNLTSGVARRRTKIAQKHNSLLYLCFLLIKKAILIESKHNFFLSISLQDSAYLKIIRCYYDSICKIFATCNEKGLSDTVLEICSVGDENKPLLVLCEEVSEKGEIILKELLENPGENLDVLSRFVPFISFGFSEM